MKKACKVNLFPHTSLQKGNENPYIRGYFTCIDKLFEKFIFNQMFV